MRRNINRVYSSLRAARSRFWARRDEEVRPGEGKTDGTTYVNPFRDDVEKLNVTKEMLLGFLRLPTGKAQGEMIRSYLYDQGHGDAFESLSDKVKESFVREIDDSRASCREVLKYHDEQERFNQNARGQLTAEESVRYVLFFYYKFFEDFDQVSFPIFFSTGVGEETDPIEVFRVSPEDACLLVDEKEVNKDRAANEDRINKLAGTTLSHFGAFFDERYRVNDILWGRLDGASWIACADRTGPHISRD